MTERGSSCRANRCRIVADPATRSPLLLSNPVATGEVLVAAAAAGQDAFVKQEPCGVQGRHTPAMVLNVVLVIATLVVSYLLGHIIAVRKARRTGLPEPGFLDYEAHRALWYPGTDYRRDPWFWVILVIAVAIVATLTKPMSFGVGFAVAAAFGFLAGGFYRKIRSQDRSVD